MQQALQQMNIQLPQVLRDITGATGMAIVRAIVKGERDSVKVAQLRDVRCKSSQETIAKALTGNGKEEDLFALKQALDLYDFYTRQVTDCDAQIQQQYATMKPRWENADGSKKPATLQRRRTTSHSKNAPSADGEAEIVRLTGVDWAAVVGIGPGLAQTILSEIGTDISKWPTDKHLTSWLGLAPRNDISGGKV
jgi:transposase